MLGTEEAETKIIGVDLHGRQQTIAMLDDQTGELVEEKLEHEGEQVCEFYTGLPHPVLVGLEATGSMDVARSIEFDRCAARESL